MIDYILSPQSIEALGWTLLFSLWQGAAFAILLVVILIALRKYTAQSRYVVSVGLLVTFFLTVSATFWKQWNEASHRLAKSELLSQQQQLNHEILPIDKQANVLLPQDDIQNATAINTQLSESHYAKWLVTFREYYQDHLPLLVTIWLLGVLFLQLRFLGQFAYVQRLKHYGTHLFPASWNDKIEELEGKLRIQKTVSYLTSVRIESPMVVGWLKPVVLLPKQLLNNLSETEIYAVLAHELAHIRREDFFINLMQTFLCNVFFFHPGVWWMSNRIDDEREHCCDDLAVAATGPATSYAKTLINVSELQLKMNKHASLAMALTGKSNSRENNGFSSRIHRLFMVSNGAGTFREGFATACILITALCLGVSATGRTINSTDSSTPIDFDQNNIESTSNIESPLISNEIQIQEQIQLPVASPEKQEIAARPQEPEQVFSQTINDKNRIDDLVIACAEEDFKSVKKLVNSGIDINGIGSEGLTPLMVATNQNNIEILEYLLSNGAEVNLTYNGWSALIEAADEGSLESMKYLLEAGADVNYYMNLDSPTAISMAASEGKLECLKLLLKNGADINGIGNSIPPLHAAAEEDKRHILSFLISQKVELDKKDAAGHTALMYAAAEGHRYSVTKLVEAGADISVKDKSGNMASDYAEKEEEYRIQDYLKAEKIPKIHQATREGHIEKVEVMVEEGMDVNTRDDYGRTALHIASALNHNIDMQVLINLGANLNAQDKQGRTPMMYAAADGKEDAVVFLVSRRADFQIKDVDGMTAYHWSRAGNNSDLVTFLGLITDNKIGISKTQKEIKRKYQDLQKELEKAEEKRIHKDIHIDVHQDTHVHKHTHQVTNGNTNEDSHQDVQKTETLHVNSEGYHLRQFDIKEKIPELFDVVRNGTVDDCRKLLYRGGVTANSSDNTGQTALMVAAMTNRLDMATLLIENGADLNQSSNSGLTALHYTALENYSKMAKLLLEYNANIDATMRYSSTDGNFVEEPIVWEYIGATPLFIAVENGNPDVMKILIEAGANTNRTLIKKEYRLDKNRVSYLSASEVMGLDEDFLKTAKIKETDESWTMYKQALLLNEPAILALIQK